MGLNKPFLVKYVLWMRQFFVNEPLNAVEKAFGVQIGDSENRLRITSWTSRGKPVVDLIVERIPQTLWVVGLAYLLSVLIAVPIGVLSAVRQNSIFDQIGTILSVIGFSLPTFFTGLMVILVFGVYLGWFPTIYDTTLKVTDWNSLVKQLKQMAMPVGVLTFFQTATLSRFTRSSMLDNLKLDYVRTARAKGLSETRVILKYPVRAALNPFASTVGYLFPYIVSGSIIVSLVLSLPTVGPLLYKALIAQDLFLAGTILLLLAVMTVIGTFVSDLVLMWIDPRIRLGMENS